MRCLDHLDSHAVALCVHCGRAMCGACLRRSAHDCCVCSDACAAASDEFDRVIGTSRRTNQGMLRGAAWVMYFLALLIAAPAALGVVQGVWVFAVMTGGFAALIGAVGVVMHVAAARLYEESPPRTG
ncbi:hypothetical protein [Alienimonas sp. DA493]|uniref:hypothetical protein n=1 Tax=Alienimonas sp. DA493 TaxID=3373605 RepID=UPI003754E0DC